MSKCITTGNGGNRGKACIFPFRYNGKIHFNCTITKGDPKPWCSTKVSKGYRHVSGENEWGYCSSHCQSSTRENRRIAGIFNN